MRKIFVGANFHINGLTALRIHFRSFNFCMVKERDYTHAAQNQRPYVPPPFSTPCACSGWKQHIIAMVSFSIDAMTRGYHVYNKDIWSAFTQFKVISLNVVLGWRPCAKHLHVFIFIYKWTAWNIRKFAPYENFPLYGIQRIHKIWVDPPWSKLGVYTIRHNSTHSNQNESQTLSIITVFPLKYTHS